MNIKFKVFLTRLSALFLGVCTSFALFWIVFGILSKIFGYSFDPIILFYPFIILCFASVIFYYNKLK